jgi:hypothetical protein
LLCGDFNLIYRDEEKSNDNLNRRMMARFWHLLNDLALKELYLNGRKYMWSNGQTPPTWVLLDRFFCTTDWEDSHVDCHLRCMASMVSDQPAAARLCPTPARTSPVPIRGILVAVGWISRSPGN